MAPGGATSVWASLQKILVGIGYFAWLIAALHRFQDWRNGEFTEAGVFDWLLLASLPLLVWIYFRYISVFGKGKGQCLLPPEERNASGD